MAQAIQQSEPGADPTVAARAVPSGQRLLWLDALRGVAATAVVLQHLAPELVYREWAAVRRVLDPGIFGVMLFFLVSGYIIPASLERRGDLREFWTGRFFRLYPLYFLVFAVSLLILPQVNVALAASAYHRPLVSAGANSVMLADLLGVGASIGVGWTLAYEMVFYFFVSALFSVDRHRRSGPVALGFAALAVLSGVLLPTAKLAHDTSSTAYLVLAAVLVVAGAMGCVLSGRPVLARAGSLALAGLGLLLVVADSRSAGFESMMIFAMMFSGTVLHRVRSGVLDRRRGAAVCALVLLAGVVSAALWDRGPALASTWTDAWYTWATAFVAAWVVFGAGFLLRHRRIPRAVALLGAVSYSVYVIHHPLIALMLRLFATVGTPVGPVRELCWMAAFFAVLLPLSYATHRLVELPGQRLGRQVGLRLRSRNR